MIIKISPEIKKILREVECSIIELKYSQISNENHKSRLSSDDIETAIKEYLRPGEEVTPAPDKYLDNLEVITIESADLITYHLDYDLWINDRQSNLTLSVRFHNKNGLIESEILDLHVM